MPVNRNAYQRYLVYDRCLQKSNRIYTVAELMREIHPPISRAMFYNDISFMRSEEGFGAPIVSRLIQGVAHYTYSEPGFSILKQPISAGERDMLSEAVTLLGRSGGLPGFEWLREMVVRLQDTLVAGQNTLPVVFFESNPYLAGLEHLNDLYRAITCRKALRVRYKPFFEKERVFVFHAWLLKQFNQRWYCIGWNDKDAMIHHLALDRMVRVRECDAPYRENAGIDFAEYFDDVVGVTVPADVPLQEVELEVDRTLWPYIRTKPIHHSQTRLRQSRGGRGIVIRLKVKPNYELESVILSFTPRVRVLKPAWLAERVEGKLSGGLAGDRRPETGGRKTLIRACPP
jgi:predicted DNA-binding transcriptional regulator YafY